MAGVLDLPTLVQRIRLDSDTAKGEADAKSATQRIGGTLTKIGAGLTAGVTLPIVGLATAGVSAASDLGESMSKVSVVFDKNADSVVDWSKDSASAMGISQQKALEAAGTFGNLFRALGLGTEPAADMSKQLVGLASDLASFNNANPEDVLLALKSGLLGEAEPLRAFGVSLSAARIEAEALASGIVKPVASMGDIATASLKVEAAAKKAAEATKAHGKESVEAQKANDDLRRAEEALTKVTAGKVPELTAAQKAQAAFNVIQKDTVLAQGDFARTSDGLANQQRIMAAEFENVKASLGQALLPIMQSAVGIVNKVFEAFQNLSPEGQKLVKIGLGIAAALGPTLIIFGKIVSSATQVGSALGSVGRGLGLLKNAEGVHGGLAKLPSLFSSIGSSIGSFVGKAAEFGKTVATMAVQAAQAAASAVASAATTVASWVATAASAVASAATVAASWLVAAAPFIAVGVAVAAVVYLIVRNWDTIKEATVAVFDAIKDFLVATWNAIKAAAIAIFDAIKAYFVFQFNLYRTIIETAWKAILLILTTTWNAIKDAAVYVFDSIKAFFERTISFWTDAIPAAWNAIKDTLAAIWQGISDAATFVFSLIRGFFEREIEGLKNIFRTGWEAIKSIIGGLIDGVRAAIELVFGGIKAFFSTWVDGVKAVLGVGANIFGAVKDAATGAGTWISEKFDAVIDFLKGIPGKVTSAAAGMFDGIKNAFKSAVNWIIDAWNGLEFKIPGFDPPGPGPKFGGFTLGVPKIPRLHEGGTLVSAGAVNMKPGEEIIQLPKAASVVPLHNRGRDIGGAGNTFYAPLIGRQYVTGVQAEDVTKGTQKALEKTVLNWGISA